MSFESWHDYGIGIKASLIDIDPVRISKFLAMSPGFKTKIEDAITDYVGAGWQWSTLSDDDLLDAIREMEVCCPPICYLLQTVINEREGIYLIGCTDYDNEEYLIFGPSYPWDMGPGVKYLTQDGLQQVFEQYISMITDQTLKELEYGDQAVENGG